MMEKIDIVILWVDGNDPVLNSKRALFGDEKAALRQDVGGPTRYANLGEIYGCVRSINKFASSFVRKIFIVTDNQDPHVESDLPVEVVDHTVIFRGYEDYLPVFNSCAIETLVHRIPGLTDHFLLMNDDFAFIRPCTLDDFFASDGRPKVYAKTYPVAVEKVLLRLSKLRDGYERTSFKRLLMNGSGLVGRHPFFFYLSHTPRTMRKSIYEEIFGEHPEYLVRNIRHRFRDPDQYEDQAMHYMALYDKGELEIVDPSSHLLYITHWGHPDRVRKKLDKASACSSFKFACFNSLDLATEQERKMVESWMEDVLK